MINKLEKLGEIVKKDRNGRVKYHPLIKDVIVPEKKKKNDKNYKYYELNVDISKEELSVVAEDVPAFDIKVLKYDVGGNTFRYLIGNYEFSKEIEKEKFNSPLVIENNFEFLKIKDSLFDSFAKSIINGRETIERILSNASPDCGVIINIKINNQEFYENQHILDIIDAVYMKDITDDVDGNILLKNSLYSFFGVYKDVTLSQGPNFSYKESFKSLRLTYEKLNNLIYGVCFHSENLKNIVSGKYAFVYVPYSDNLTYDMIDRRLGKKIYNNALSESNEDIQEMRNTDDSTPIEDLLNHGFNFNEKENHEQIYFDIIFKLKGKNVSSDLIVLRNYSITRIEKLNSKVSEIRKKLGNYKTDINYSFVWFFKLNDSKELGAFGALIFKWIVEIFEEKYYENLFVDTTLIQKAEYIARNVSEHEVKFEYRKLLINYKFLRYMEKNGENKFLSELDTQSYKLGKELGLLCQTWQEDRENLRDYIKTFNGQISRRVRTLEDVDKFCVDFLQRLIINSCKETWKYNYDKYVGVFNTFNEKFNAYFFIRGYFDSQYSYHKKQEEK